MTETAGRIDVPGRGSVSCVLTGGSEAKWLFVYAPGAGANIDDPFGLYTSQALPVRGIDVMRFQFPYQERRLTQGRGGGPDRPEVLEAAWRAALEMARQIAGGRLKVAAGGRSMGGRIASQVASAEAVDALALFAYPLHPPGRPQQRRDAHLRGLAVPVLFCSGTRDGFASPEELTELAGLMPSAGVHLLAGADHGFGMQKSTGRTREDVWREACDALVDFLTGIACSS